MSPHCSRKSFLVKLGGMLAAASFVPALMAKMGAGLSRRAAPVTLRPEPRAVSRKEGSC